MNPQTHEIRNILPLIKGARERERERGREGHLQERIRRGGPA